MKQGEFFGPRWYRTDRRGRQRPGDRLRLGCSRDDRLPYAFLSSQGGPMTRQAWYYLVGQAGDRAGLGAVHPHMLRRTTGHLLADRDTRVLQDWLGHRDIRHTAHYSRTSSKRFEGLWGR